jgi:hypothetical protein
VNFYLVYWYNAENKRENGTTLAYASSKRDAHQIVRNAVTPHGVTAMIPTVAELLTPQIEEEIGLMDADKSLARFSGYVTLEHGT